jgi:hypothetical protein
MKNWLIKKLLRQGDTVDPTPPHSDGQETDTEAGPIFSSDEPIRSRTQDRYNRWPFAKRVADTLAARKDPSSIVIGLYGPWGDGKTSTLHMMRAALSSYDHVVVVSFNPWLFQTEEQLMRGFFETLADSIDRSLPTRAEKIGGVLKRYGSLLSIASIPIAPGVDLKPGEAAKGIGETLSTVSLEELRDRVERFLAQARKRVVVLVDDIDRLDRLETQAILKLVKLSAGFKHTSYVLSFDDEMVAAAIGERYAGGGASAGRSFLEKIIQVPLHLPRPDEVALRASAFEGVDAALKTAAIELPQDQVDSFVRHFVDGLEPRLETPRHAKLYANAIMFALPLLKGEASCVDQLLIEGIRIFYPSLYRAVRDNADLFLTSDHDGNRNGRGERANQVIEGALDDVSPETKKRVRERLLEALFPRLGRMGYGAEWDEIWDKDQRICSPNYFARYFTYSIPPGDVADHEIDQFLESLTGADSRASDAMMASIDARTAMPQFIRKLRLREDSIDPNAARRLAVAIARNGVLMPSERGMLVAGGTRGQAAILVVQLLRRVQTGDERDAIADEILRAADPLPFAWECYRWIRHGSDRPEERRVLRSESEPKLAELVVKRIREQDARAPLYQTFGRDAAPLYWLWGTRGDQAALQVRLTELFERDGDAVDRFLDIYVGEAWGMDSGLPSRADFDRGAYNALAHVIDPTRVFDHLLNRHGAGIEMAEYHQSRDVPTALRFARQFAVVHRRVLQEKGAGAADKPESQ